MISSLYIGSVYSFCLSVVLVVFEFGRDEPDGYLVGKELVIMFSECDCVVRKNVFLCFMKRSFHGVREIS